MNLYGCFLTLFCHGAVAHALAGLWCISPTTLCVYLGGLLSRQHLDRSLRTTDANILDLVREIQRTVAKAPEHASPCASPYEWLRRSLNARHIYRHTCSPHFGQPHSRICWQLSAADTQLVQRLRHQVVPWPVSEALVWKFWYKWKLMTISCMDYMLPYVYMCRYEGLHWPSIQISECFQIRKYHGKINTWSIYHPSRPDLWFL